MKARTKAILKGTTAPPVAPPVIVPARERYRPAWCRPVRTSFQHMSKRVTIWVTMIQLGELRIPKFQRAFVWTDEQILLLLESLFEGDYVGSLLLWERQKEAASVEHFGESPFGSPEGNICHVIDGQQRLGALVVAFCSGRFYFNATDGTFGTASGIWRIPLKIVHGDGYNWLAWYKSHAAEHHLDELRVLDCMSAAITKLTDMEVSSIVLPAHWTLERVLKTFVMINTAGTPVSATDLTAALQAAY